MSENELKIAVRDKLLSELHVVIIGLRDEIAKRDQLISELKTGILDGDRRIKELKTKVLDGDRRIKELESQILNLESDVVGTIVCQQEVEAILEEQIAHLEDLHGN